ncbi:hypothetical protein KC324_g19256, partial [Hortaea werneckii]
SIGAKLPATAKKSARRVQPSAKPVVFTVRVARHAVSLAPPVLKSTVAPVALTAFNAVCPVPLPAIGFLARRDARKLFPAAAVVPQYAVKHVLRAISVKSMVQSISSP